MEKCKFMNLSTDDFLTLENDQVVIIKLFENSTSRLAITYEKEAKRTYVTYGKSAILELNATNAADAVAEAKNRALEIMAEMVSFTAWSMSKKSETL